jgi:hypothetical protein
VSQAEITALPDLDIAPRSFVSLPHTASFSDSNSRGVGRIHHASSRLPECFDTICTHRALLWVIIHNVYAILLQLLILSGVRLQYQLTRQSQTLMALPFTFLRLSRRPRSSYLFKSNVSTSSSDTVRSKCWNANMDPTSFRLRVATTSQSK